MMPVVVVVVVLVLVVVVVLVVVIVVVKLIQCMSSLYIKDRWCSAVLCCVVWCRY